MVMNQAVNSEVIDYLLACDEPWTRYRTMVDLLGRDEADVQVREARAEMVDHPQVRELVAAAAGWPGYALKRHNDSRHPLYAFSTLADFGLQYDDPGLDEAMEAVLKRQSSEGAFQTQVRLQRQFGGLDGEYWTWMACDAPTLLYALLAMGLGDDPQVRQAAEHLAGQATGRGWLCSVAPELGKFRGPGRKDDPCPIANVYALKALSLLPEYHDSHATRRGTEMLLWHWQIQKERKLYLFGIGGDFRKLKYPYVWYDLLHVVDVLSRFPFIHGDERLRQMAAELAGQAGDDGRYTATSMYRAWKGWSFADKKAPSPWLTFLAWRALRRIGPSDKGV